MTAMARGGCDSYVPLSIKNRMAVSSAKWFFDSDWMVLLM